MAIDLSASPYFDDYEKAKGFHRVLFKPGRAVQVRELNQLQTMMQEQVTRVGDHLFENGSLVVPGELKIDTDANYAKISSLSSVFSDIDIKNGYVAGVTSGVTAQLILSIDSEDLDPITIYVKYTNSGSTFDKKAFSDSETVNIYNSSDELIATATIDETGKGSTASITDGIYYTKGNFVIVNSQTIVLDKYDVTPSYKIGLDVIETIVTEAEDSSLFDNANGSFNYAAPGAARLTFELNLQKYELSDTNVDEFFIQIMGVDAGQVITHVRTPQYSVIGETLARRTFDESGNYTVDPFLINVVEHLKEGSVDGILSLADGGDSSKYAIMLDPGKAYVNGYEIETLSTTVLAEEKARDVDHINNASLTVGFGNYVLADTLNKLPNFKNFGSVTLYSGASTIAGAVPAGSVVGTARIRHVEYESGVYGSAAIYKIYVFDVKNASGVADQSVINNTQSMYSTGDAFPFTCNLTSSSVFDASFNSSVYALTMPNVATLKDGSNAVDTTYTVTRVINTTADASGVVNVNANTNEIFAAYSNKNYSISVVDDAGETIVDPTGAITIGGAPVGKQLSVNFTVTYANKPVRVVATVIKQIAYEKSKTVTTTSKSGSLTSGVLKLDKADAFELVSIIDDTTSQDITDRYQLYTGKTPNYYGVSYVKIINGMPAPATTVTVSFKYFSHGAGDYFSVDSYSSIDYEDIPKENLFGGVVSLSDVLDFRPRIDNTGSNFTAAGSSLVELPQNLSVLRADFDYYMPRIDSVYVDESGGFGVVKGISNNKPTVPDIPDNAMRLYDLIIPAYTKKASDIVSNYKDNKRYTMQDIGKLDRRISNLEYYSVLNALEKEASEMQVIDPTTGLNRFKNGFLVDTFSDQSVGDASNANYMCSVDESRGVMRPEFMVEGVDLVLNASESSNYVNNDGFVTLPFTSVASITQPYASGIMNINPFAVFGWWGSVNLSPSKDTWVDTRYTAPIIQNNTVVRESTTTSSSVVNATVTRDVVNTVRSTEDFFISPVVTFALNRRWNWWGRNWVGDRIVSALGIESARPLTNSNTSQSTEILRETIVNRTTTSTSSVSSKEVGDRVVSSSIVPFMRAKTISFSANGMKPNTRVYPFFDGVNVSTQCTPSGGSLGGAIITNGAGFVSGTYALEDGKFRTGERQFKLIDNPGSDADGDATTSANGVYSATGTTKVHQKTILSTRVINTVTNIHTTNMVTNQITNRISLPPVRFGTDPLAQSFAMSERGGAFITSITAYFQSKDASIPVRLELRDVVNGYPGPNIVPGGVVTLEPSSVNISDNATAATEFVFSHPLYVQEGVEYCFVLLANSIKYNVWIATMGENVVNTSNRISKQPYVGVLFKSQNNTTWSADQQSDIKFIIKRANFNTGVTGNVVMNNAPIDPIFGINNPLLATNGSAVVKVTQYSHGLFVGSSAPISGATIAHGVLTGDINKTHTVTAVNSVDEFEITLANPATATGYFGGDVALIGKNFLFDVANVNVNTMAINQTSIDTKITTTTGKSIDGSETPYLTGVSNQYVTLSENLYFNAPQVVLDDDDETANLGGAKSFKTTLELKSSASNLSPVVDTVGSSVILISNRINNPSTLDESDDGNAIARYITSPASLQLPANSLKMYVDVNRPFGSDIKVYYKVGSSLEDLSTSTWSELPVVSGLVVNDDNNMYEAELGVNDLGEFSVYQIKMALVSESSSMVPTVDRLRVIALGT